MKRLSFFILALAILFLAVPAVQAADYALLKNDYIRAHPGQAIIPYPWEPVTSTKVLPFNYEVPAAPGNTLSITACRNEFEPASFVITAQKDLSGINIFVPNLKNAQGNTIPADAIDVRLVKVWYQANENAIQYTTGRFLTPELLIKDDSLVKVDYTTRTNYLKVTINGVVQYIDISNRYATFPSNARIQDASSLQPFTLKANENKQIWVTVHVPGSAPAGDYSGNMVISAPSEVPVVMTLNVRVLPFELEPSPLEYGLYNYGILGTQDVTRHSYRSPETYSIELQDMKDHGVLYPALYQQDNGKLDKALTLRNAAGLPKDKIYLLGVYDGHDSYIGSGSTSSELAEIAATVKNMRNHTKAYGYTETYFYGLDEVKGDALLAERAAWQTVHANDGKIYAAGKGSELLKMGDVLDTGIVCSTLNATQANLFHKYGLEILSYGNPQSGIENPEIYRKNYGFSLWNAGYDGAMAFAYQFPYGKNIWNDYDDLSDGTLYRDHVFAYPTSNGVIDTIQWEGFREGVDDTRYVGSLIKKVGSTSARTIIANSLSQGTGMATTRKNVINQILSYTSGSIPTPTPTPTPTPAPTQPSLASVMVTTPNGGESWIRGTTPMIGWTSSGSVGSSVKIELMKAGVVSQTISASTPNDGKYTSWTIPSTLATGTDYRIRITSTTNTAITDTTNNYFIITTATTPSPSTITATAPNGGETWTRGTTPTIRWTSSGSVGSSVKIELMKAGVVSQTISTSTANDGTFTSWTIPSSLATGTDYRIRITSTTNTAIADTSNNYFTITSTTPSPAAITISAPNGGEKWARGTTPTIKWSSSGSVGAYVKVELMKAGAVSKTISSSTPNDGTFTSWTIPSTLATGTDYRIRITSTTNAAIADTSNNYFTITAATISSTVADTVTGFG